MDRQAQPSYTAFAGHTHICSGDLATVAGAAKKAIEGGDTASILIFDNGTGRVVDVDFRGIAEDVVALIANSQQLQAQSTQKEEASSRPQARPGRPKLGVISREVTLLPRHWEWLKNQRGGASVTLRRLVDQARRDSEPENQRRELQTTVYRFMTAIGGDLPCYEEALRALYAGDKKQFLMNVNAWPIDVRNHVVQLSKQVFGEH